MDIFKTSTGISPIHKINAENFEKHTGKKKPYRLERDGKISYYGVCPECDNPIQIVGIFKDTAEAKRKPYGRHNGTTIPSLAIYNEEDYRDCSYSNPDWKSNTQRRKPTSKIAQNTLSLLKEQFDRIIYILSKQTDLKIGANLAEKMLTEYLNEEGWLYRDATMNNLPWIFGQCSPALPLFGKFVVKDSLLHKEIEAKCPSVEFVSGKDRMSQYVQVKQKKGQFISLYFAFANYNKTITNNHLSETIDFWVYEDTPVGEEPVTIHKKELDIDTSYFMHLIQVKENEKFRNDTLLAISAKHIT